MGFVYDDIRKDLPSGELHKLFISVGWSDGSEAEDLIENITYLLLTLRL